MAYLDDMPHLIRMEDAADEMFEKVRIFVMQELIHPLVKGHTLLETNLRAGVYHVAPLVAVELRLDNCFVSYMGMTKGVRFTRALANT